MIASLYKNFKLRLWHFLFMPSNVSGVISGKVELTRLIERLSEKTHYYLVYQYGKCGSSTVSDFFNRLKLTTIHCHNLNDKTLKIRDVFAVDQEMPKKVAGQRFISNARYRIYQNFLFNKYNKQVNIFISLREPEGFLRSMYFQQWKLFSLLTIAKYEVLDINKFTDFFNESLELVNKMVSDDAQQQEIESLMLCEDLDFGARCLLHFIYGYVYWFELELFEMFDISVDDICKQDGFWRFEKKNIKGSIIKVEDFDHSLNDSLKFLLGEEIDISLENKNVAQDKANFEYYEYLKKNAVIPEKVSKLMKGSFSYSHFYK